MLYLVNIYYSGPEPLIWNTVLLAHYLLLPSHEVHTHWKEDEMGRKDSFETEITVLLEPLK